MNHFTPTPARPLREAPFMGKGGGSMKITVFLPTLWAKKLQKKTSPPPWGGGRGVGMIAAKKVSYTKDSLGNLPLPVPETVQKLRFMDSLLKLPSHLRKKSGGSLKPA